MRSEEQTINVTGSAKKDIVSDLGFLRGSISIQSATAESAYRALVNQKPQLLSYLKSKGFPENQVKFYPMTNYQVFDYDGNGRQIGVKGHVYSQRMEIQSGDVKKIQAISLDIASLIENGVYFTVESPEFYYTKIADVKIQIQAAAARDARDRAEKIVKATGSDLGPRRSGRMGVLQIIPKNSNEISDYGVNDVSSIEKEVIAVVNASFQIK